MVVGAKREVDLGEIFLEVLANQVVITLIFFTIMPLLLTTFHVGLCLANRKPVSS